MDLASLMAQYDTSSIGSQLTDTLSKLSLAFSFDHTFFTYSVYERFFRGVTKRHVGVPKSHISPDKHETTKENKRERYCQTLLFISSDYSGLDAML
jgi:hypothetical protein